MKPIAEALAELSPKARAEIEKPAQKIDPRYAEIVGSNSPNWYVVEVFASAQADVVQQLVEHRYGVYVPEVDETVIRRGKPIERRVPMFSGYVFVFMWICDEHWQWISNVPGVVGIIGWLPDGDIDIVRAVENGKRPVAIELPDPEPEPVPIKKSKKKKRWKGRKSKAKAVKPKIITEADLRAEIVTTRAWSAFDDILELDADGRNQTLRRAMGLPESV